MDSDDDNHSNTYVEPEFIQQTNPTHQVIVDRPSRWYAQEPDRTPLFNQAWNDFQQIQNYARSLGLPILNHSYACRNFIHLVLSK